MDSTEEKLIKVFQIVFPDLPEEKVREASQQSVASWDSVAAITLLNVIEEEFGIQMDFDEAAELTSFGLVLNHLKSLQGETATVEKKGS